MLVANRSVEQAAEAMYRLATQHGLAAHLGSQAPRSVSEKFSKERAAKRLAAVYEALLAQ
jgi:glycosyltransferase involved in cell wall biosynthesis